MTSFPILTSMILCPAAALLATLLIPGRNTRAIKVANALCGLASGVLAVIVWMQYDHAVGGYQMLRDVAWVPTFGIHYTVAVDGAGVVLNLLTAIVFFAGVLSMWSLDKRVKEYFAFMATLVFGVFGVFSSLDIVAFFFFSEVAVLPMYPLIAIWGSTRKEYSAMKLTLYLMAGSALLFPGLIALYVHGGVGSWNIVELAASGNFTREAQIFIYPFLYVGFGVLAGMFPFHGWSPTGHVAAPTAVSMLHAGVLMKLGAFGIFRIAMTILPIGARYWAPSFAVLAQIAIGGGDHAHIDRLAVIGADRPHLALLQYAQQLALQAHAHVADLVEKERALFGFLEEAALVLRRPREGAAYVAEAFALHQPFGQRGAVDRHEGLLGPDARDMTRAGDGFLAGSALAA